MTLTNGESAREKAERRVRKKSEQTLRAAREANELRRREREKRFAALTEEEQDARIEREQKLRRQIEMKCRDGNTLQDSGAVPLYAIGEASSIVSMMPTFGLYVWHEAQVEGGRPWVEPLIGIALALIVEDGKVYQSLVPVVQEDWSCVSLVKESDSYRIVDQEEKERLEASLPSKTDAAEAFS